MTLMLILNIIYFYITIRFPLNIFFGDGIRHFIFRRKKIEFLNSSFDIQFHTSTKGGNSLKKGYLLILIFSVTE